MDKVLKTAYTDKDLKTFDKLLSASERGGVERGYNRPLARIKLQRFLAEFTEDTQKKMFEKIKNW